METHLGTNSIPMLVFLPIVLVVGAGIVWMIVKTPAKLWKRLVMAVMGLFTLFGLAVLLLTVYYHRSPGFADTFRFYAYSQLAPSGDPFKMANNEFHPVIMMRDVANKNGAITLLSHPNPDYPTYIALFVRGKYMEAEMKNNVLTIPADVPGSLPNVMPMSLWWALTKNIDNLVSSAK